MKIILTTILLTFLSLKSFTQDYQTIIGEAEKAKESKDYKTAMALYEKAFATGKSTNLDFMRASSTSVNATDNDKAFFYLNKAIDNGWDSFDFLPKIESFKVLYSDKRWNEVLEKCKGIKEKELKSVKYPALIPKLDSMYKVDQDARTGSSKLMNEKRTDSPEYKAIRQLGMKVDSLNMIELKKIYTQYGFLGFDKVGKMGSDNFWLLLQHCDRDVTFQEEVLGAMKKELDLKNANPKNYAYLIDRVKVNTKQLQIYGTQAQVNKDRTSYEPKPVIDPENLNKRRLGVGLESIESYMNTMNEVYKGSLNKK